MKEYIILFLMIIPWVVNAIGVTIQENTTFELQEGTSLKLPSGSVLQVDSAGRFNALGALDDTAVVTRSEAAGSISVSIDGDIECDTAKFEYMDTNGVWMKDDANIIKFQHVNLANPVGTGAALLRMECGPDTLNYIHFDNAADYNVRSYGDYPSVAYNYYGFDDGCTGLVGDQYDDDLGDTDPNSPNSQGWVIWLGALATELVSFDAQAGWEEVILRWVSEVEINTKRYVLERSLYKDSGFEPIKEVPARGGGGTYSYLDKEVVPGMLYWYKLIAMDADSAGEEWGPLQATPKKYELVPFTLRQNVPNPFNNSTSIKFSVPGKRPSEVKLPVSLRVYDLSGRVVEELMHGKHPPGWYEVSWEPKERSGIYFYRLEAGEKSLSKKLVVY